MIRITQRGVSYEPGDVERLKAEFDSTGCAKMPGFLTPELLNPLLEKLATASLHPKDEVIKGIYSGTTCFAPDHDPIVRSAVFILNHPVLFRLVEAITGCPHLENYRGRVHRTEVNPAHHIDWHDDAVFGRVAAINVNLTLGKYSGGLFQLRNPVNGEITEIGQTPPGDAFLFRISGGWDHRLTPVTEGSRTVSVGWFRTSPERQVFANEWMQYVSSERIAELTK